MSVDDQLFKEDGTLLTRVDILILKTARWFANVFFAEDDDETYDHALRKMMKTASVILVGSGVIRFIMAILLNEEPMLALGVAVLAAFIASLYWGASQWTRCDGRGSTIDQKAKLLALFFLCWPPALSLIDIAAYAGGGAVSSLVGNLLFNVGFWQYIIASEYVKRLQAKPPKKKRVHAFKLAFGFNR